MRDRIDRPAGVEVYLEQENEVVRSMDSVKLAVLENKDIRVESHDQTMQT